MESNLSRADVAEFLVITHDAAGRFVGQRAVMTLALCSLLNAHTHTHTHTHSLSLSIAIQISWLWGTRGTALWLLVMIWNPNGPGV